MVCEEHGGDVGVVDEVNAPEPGRWAVLSDADGRLQAPDEITPVLLDPQLDHLPTSQMTWPSFEKLLLRIAREVQGLRSVRLYGVPGQKQDGIDVAGINSATENEAVQGKKYQTFSLSDLNAAVDKYVNGSLPFSIVRLAIGVSCAANETAITARILKLNEEHPDVEFEIWDQERISEMLRDRPDIVREFFGEVAAARFCSPHEIAPIPVPSPDAVALADAVMQGPLEASGAAQELVAADASADPNAAAAHVANAQDLLRTRGFAAHAQGLDVRLATLLKEAGRHEEAALLLASRAWDALEEDATHTAQLIVRTLEEWAKELGDDLIRQISVTMSCAFDAYEHPLGAPPHLPAGSSTPRELRARLLLLAGEMSFALGDPPFDDASLSIANALLAETGPLDALLQIRIELCIAESNGDWTSLLQRARTRRLPRHAAALVLAHHARHLAAGGAYAEAQLNWAEAVEQACLSGHNHDAARWLFSQRLLATRTSPLFEDPYWPVASALRRAPSRPPVVPTATSALESAVMEVEAGKDRPAAIRLQRVIRDGLATADISAEYDGHIRLGRLLTRSGELGLASRHFILAGAGKEAEDLGKNLDAYIDVSEFIDHPTHWVRAAAFKLIAAEADLVPDQEVGGIVDRSLSTIDAILAGHFKDSPLFGPHAYLAAFETIAALGDRLTATQADKILDLLEPLTTVTKAGQYRHTDDSHALICARVGSTQPSLLPRTVDQLLTLFERAPHSVKAEGRALLADNLSHSRERLHDMATSGNRFAAALLAHVEPDRVTEEQVEAAAASLAAPSTNSAGVYSVGSDAPNQAVIASRLPPQRRAALIQAQLDLCASPYELAANRVDYLHAAAILAVDLLPKDASALFRSTRPLAAAGIESEADASQSAFRHPLGAFRINVFATDRPVAVFLLSRLAKNPAEKRLALSLAAGLIGDGEEAERWATYAFQELQDDMDEAILQLLARQTWALRCLAAIRWARTESLGPELGELLAADPDARVRRSLAKAVADVAPSVRTDSVRRSLASDTRHSVRRLLAASAEPAS